MKSLHFLTEEKDMIRTLSSFATFAGLLACLAFLPACQSLNPACSDAFPPGTDVDSPRRIVQAQAAAGACADATLYNVHFDDCQLNSLGQSKLQLMLEARTPGIPMVVYVDTPADSPLWAARTQCVRACLAKANLPESQLKLVAGINPQTLTPAKDLLDRLPKTESGSAVNPNAPAATPESPLGNLGTIAQPTGH